MIETDFELKEFEKISVRVQALAEICQCCENNIRWTREQIEKFESRKSSGENTEAWEQNDYLCNLEKISAYEDAYKQIMKAMIA